MWSDRRLTDLFGAEYPIIQAPKYPPPVGELTVKLAREARALLSRVPPA